MSLALFGGHPISDKRVLILAEILCGFRWPNRSHVGNLKKGQREAAMRIARTALESLAEEPD